MHTWIICSTKWIRLEKPACEDLGRIANRFDGFRLLGITIDSVLARHRVNIRMCVYTFYVYVSSSKRVKERIWKKFVCAMAGFVVSLEYRDETCFFIPITLSFSFWKDTRYFLSVYSCVNDIWRASFNITSKVLNFFRYMVRTSASCYYRSSKVHWSKAEKEKGNGNGGEGEWSVTNVHLRRFSFLRRRDPLERSFIPLLPRCQVASGPAAAFSKIFYDKVAVESWNEVRTKRAFLQSFFPLLETIQTKGFVKSGATSLTRIIPDRWSNSNPIVYK